MSWSNILAEARDTFTPAALLAALVMLPLLRTLGSTEARRRGGLILGLFAHLTLMLVGASLRETRVDPYGDVHLLARIAGAATVVLAVAALLFLVLIPRAGVRIPRIVQDVVTATAVGLTGLTLASAAGIEVTSVLATSAVVTVVIGFALQDTLGNVFAGLALQADDSIRLGDWITVGEHTGRVTEMRWRYTAIETRNWETLFIPNAVLTKQQVLVLGRRTGQRDQLRRWVYFNVDFRYQPSDVTACVAEALNSAPIDNVALQPPPNCILMGFEPSYCKYAVRYWLTDLAVDDPTDSVVRTRIYFALKRMGIPLAIPAGALFMTKEGARRRKEKTSADASKRREVIEQIRLFAALDDADKSELAASLRYAPFARGEIMTREGATAHWLYIIIEGEASIRVTTSGGTQLEVGRSKAGSFFGEMSLMTGEPRAATVVALSDVECYRLDSEAFQRVLERRPELVESLAGMLAERRLQLEQAREKSARPSQPAELAHTTQQFVQKMRRFFGL